MPAESNDLTPDDDNQTDTPPREGRLTRKRVADRLGVSIFKVRSMEGKELHPAVCGGVHYFDPEEVESVSWVLGTTRGARHDKRDEGEIAALAFYAFDEGKDLHEIVTVLRIPPERVRALYREWRQPDLERHEITRRKRARIQLQQRQDEQEQRRHEREMERLTRDMAQFARLGKT